MARNKTVADAIWEMLAGAGVRRCYGIVGDALNPVIDALRRNGSVDFVHVRHEEYGAFAAPAVRLVLVGVDGQRYSDQAGCASTASAGPPGSGPPCQPAAAAAAFSVLPATLSSL